MEANAAEAPPPPTAPTVRELSGEPSSAAFFAEHVERNRPLVVRGGCARWAATNWCAESLRKFGDEPVRVAPLVPTGAHAYCDKWLEPAALWTPHAEPEPGVVREDVVLAVAAARVHMPLRRFVDLLEPRRSAVAAAFYADGAGNLARSFPFLADDFAPPPMAAMLQLKRADLWIGHTSVSRMHYDNLDNLFAQVVGAKTFVLAEPAAAAHLVQGRLRKANYVYEHPGVFTRGAPTDETVINYCGADRPPEVPTVSVRLEAGDLLYLPFGWWHEVHAHPDEKKGLCAAVSHFYHPYWCRLGGPTTTELGPMILNPRYHREREEGAG